MIALDRHTDQTTNLDTSARADATLRDPRWTTIRNRDAAGDGQFVYAVRTTGVYCRPQCPARPARPENVAFFAGPAEAEAAGFRACLRCRPSGVSRDEEQAEAVARACRLIAEAEEPPRLDALARSAGMSAFHFHRVFKAVTGLTPKAWAAAHRAEKVRGVLAEGRGSVTEAIYDAGFNAASRFYDKADQVLGMTATAFRQGGTRTRIRFAVAQCSLGAILVAQSEKGVCAIFIGDDPDALVRDLQGRFPRAELVGGDAAFDATVAAVIGFVEAPRIGLALPLDLQGTAFQQRVWQALGTIPLGQTATYADIARTIGEPRSVRAVAQACGANKVAVAIPCHRVVRSDGGLSGYRWGVERKRALLDRESASAPAGA